MPHQKKTPPIKLSMDKSFFNLIIHILIQNENITEDLLCERANKLKSKLLKYTKTYNTVDKMEIAKAAFYNREIIEVVEQLLVFIATNTNIDLENDYYSLFLKNMEGKQITREE